MRILHLVLLPVIVLLIMANPSAAQTSQGQHEISFSHGMIPGIEIDDFLSVTEDNNGNNETAHTPIFFATYRYYLTNNFAIGLTIGNQYIDGYVNDNSDYGIFISNYHLQHTIIASEYLVNYMNNKYCRLYGFLGIGISDNVYNGFSNPDNRYSYGVKPHTIYPAMQLTPIGYSLGGRFSYYFEFGIGYKGLINTGFSYRIGKQRVHHTYNEDLYKDEKQGSNTDMNK